MPSHKPYRTDGPFACHGLPKFPPHLETSGATAGNKWILSISSSPYPVAQQLQAQSPTPLQVQQSKVIYAFLDWPMSCGFVVTSETVSGPKPAG